MTLPASQSFLQRLRHNDYFVRDHRVHGVRTLPGVVLLDMVYRLSASHLHTTSIELRDIVFIQPIVTSTEYDVDIILTLTMSGDDSGGEVTIHSRKVPKANDQSPLDVLNMKCRFYWLSVREEPVTATRTERRVPVPAPDSLGLQTWDMDQVYQLARQANIQHFEFMKNQGVVYRQNQLEWMDIQLSPLAEQYIDKFHAHVALLDGATFAGSSFRLGHSSNGSGDAEVPPYIPFMIERFVIYDRFPAEIRTCTEQTASDLSGGDIISRSITITDREGRVLAEFEHLKAKKIRHAASITGLTHLMNTSGNDAAASEVVATSIPEETLFTDPSEPSVDQIRNQISTYVKTEIARILNISANAVDEHAGFYEQGLDSVHLLDLVKHLEKRMNTALYPTLLFEHSSVQALTEYLVTHCAQAWIGASERIQEEDMNAFSPQSEPFDSEHATSSATIPMNEHDIEMEEQGEPVCYEPQWVETPRMQQDMISTENTFAPTQDVRTDQSLSRIVVLYGNYPDLALRLELESDIYEVHILPDHIPMNAELYREKVTALYRIIQGIMIQPTLGKRIVLQVLADTSDAEGYMYGFEGLVKTAAMELPAFGAQLIRIDRHESFINETLIDQLRHEAEGISSGSAVSIWYRGVSLQRYARKLIEIPVPKAVSQNAYIHDGVYLITGGLGGLGYALATHISRQSRCKLVLIGRSPLNEHTQYKLNLLRNHGAEAIYIQADMTVQSELQQVIHQIRNQYAKITGVFHCAGDFNDQLMLQKHLSDLDQVLKPKIDGFWNLEHALHDFKPEFMVTFSSLSAITGNRGQADYATANSCMDRILANPQQNKATEDITTNPITRRFTINWPLWSEGGMQVNDHIRNSMYSSSGSMPLPLAVGMTIIDRILAQQVSQIVLLYGNKSRIQSAMTELKAIHLPSSSNPDDIAVIGIAGRYPSANHVHELGQILKEGRDCITSMPDERWKQLGLPYAASDYYSAGGFLDMIDDFDPAFFHISPLQAEMMDPQSRLFLQAAWTACEDAGFTIERDRRGRASTRNRKVGVFAGVFWNHYELLGAAMTQNGTPTATGSNASVIANLVSYHMNFQGPSIAVDSMCSSSLTAIHLACESIRHGQSQYAIAGGVNLVTHPHKYVFLKQAKFLSADGKCRSFGKDGDGYVPGEGVGAVLLTTVAEARKHGYPIYGVIKGSALNHAGKTSGTTVPDPVAQSEVIADALAAAGVEPGTIGYVEAHGTGTSLGDPIEIQGLERAFNEHPNPGRSCAVGSLKSNIGHLEAAAGVAGLTKLLLQFKYGQLFPSLHAQEPNPLISFEKTCFHVQQTLQPWERRYGYHNARYEQLPIRAGLSSFGATGSNAHLIVEEYIAPISSWSESAALNERNSGSQATETVEVLLPLSAKTEERLLEYARQVRSYLQNEGLLVDLVDIAYSFQVGRNHMKHRVAWRGRSHSELVELIEHFLDSSQHDSAEPSYTSFSAEPSLDKLYQWSELWEQGEEVNWGDLYDEVQMKPAIVRVPTYPFSKKRYWLRTEKIHITPEETQKKEELPQEAKVKIPSSFQEDSREEQARSVVTQAVSALLKVSITDLDSDAEWAEYGFDSILFTELADRLNHNHAFGLTPAIFFEHATIRELAVHLLHKHGPLWTMTSTEKAVLQPERALNHDNVDLPKLSKDEQIQPSSSHRDATGEEQPLSGFSSTDTSTRIHSGSVQQSSMEPIAIVGISSKFPMADNTEQFWLNLLHGKDCITEIPEERWCWQDFMGDPHQEDGKTNVKNGGFINGIGEFDPLFFGISPKEAVHMDPQQRLLMMHVWSVIEDAGYAPSDLSGSAMGLFIGTGSSGYNVMMAQSNETVEAYSVTATVPSVGPNRMSYTLNIHGPSQPIETSCSSSLVAIHRAVQAIQNGDCETAVVGGVNTILSVDAHISLSKAGMLSADGRCKTFSTEANGYGRGEGVGMIFLKKLSDAQRDRDHIYGLIRGSGENHGGKAGSLTAPNPKAQTALLNTVYARAGIDPSTINYIEAHGTGTPLGDPIEINALKAAFQEMKSDLSPEQASSRTTANSSEEQSSVYCGIGSVKTNIGHLELASGIAGVIKVLLQMKHRKLVPSLHSEEISPYIQLEDSPFYIVKQVQDWIRLRDSDGCELPRRAGVSSFGFGGSNAHVILEEYIPEAVEYMDKAVTTSECSPVAIVLSAKNKKRLREQMVQLADYLQRTEEADTGEQLHRIACTLQTGRQAMEYRAGFMAVSIADLKSLLDNYVGDARLWSDSDHTVLTPHSSEAMTNHKLYLGSTAAHRRTAALFKEDEDLRQALDKWITRRKFNKLLELWVQGVDIRWELLYQDNRPERISLPAYPFARENYWIDTNNPRTGTNELDKATNEDTQEPLPVQLVKETGTPDHNALVEDEVRDIVVTLLGITSQAIDEHRSLEDYGMDSVLALQLLHHLQTRISVEIGIEDLNSCHTLHEVNLVCLNHARRDQQRLIPNTP